MPATASNASAERILEGSGGRRWRIQPTPDIEAFRGADWPPLISLLLANRDVRGLPEALDYIGEPGELTDPALMPNLDVAVERLEAACAAGETVAIFGDFDVDGLTSTTILTEGLRDLGARPLPYVPDRFSEGYGPNVQAIRGLHAQGASVLITADCGTSALREVELANELGMDVIVIDHHTAPDELPEALALVNPKLRDSQYGSEPAAVGVAHKVVHDLYERSGREFSPDEHHALVALGTVCDLAPMLSENRDLVRIGIKALARAQRPGLRALAEAAKVNLAEADVEMCGWQLGPRLNAAGRMAHARIALDLLLTDDEDEARRLATELDRLNRQRREDTVAAVEEAEALLSAEDRAAPLIIVASERISQGIVGLVASRLVEAHHRPAIALQLLEGEGPRLLPLDRRLRHHGAAAPPRRSLPALRRPPRRRRLQHRPGPPPRGPRAPRRRRRRAPHPRRPHPHPRGRDRAAALRRQQRAAALAQPPRPARHRQSHAALPRAGRAHPRRPRGRPGRRAPAVHAQGGPRHLARHRLPQRRPRRPRRRPRRHRLHLQQGHPPRHPPARGVGPAAGGVAVTLARRAVFT